MNSPDNSQAFADTMTANILRCRAHDIATVSANTGKSLEVAEEAIRMHGDKWAAVRALRAA